MNLTVGLEDILLIVPIIILFVTSLVPVTLNLMRRGKELHPYATVGYSLCGILLAAAFFSLVDVQRQGFSGSLVYDGVVVWTGLLILFALSVSLFLSVESQSSQRSHFAEQVFLMLNTAVGMLILLMANDLLLIFVGLELMSLALYVLIALSRESKLSKEAAFKYFILGSFASAILLYGMSFLYGTVGSVYLSDLSQVAGELMGGNLLFTVGFTLVALGFAFKMGMFPFHSWVPDVYQGSPTPLTGFMASAVKAVIVVAFFRFLLTTSLDHESSLLVILQWLAVGTMLVGNIGAIIQQNLKRILAYSSVAHSGYVLVGLLAASLQVDVGLSISGVLFYLLSYTLMTLGSFALVATLEGNENRQIQLEDLSGLASRRPWLAFIFALLLLSLAGLPPTLGFFAKLYIFAGALKGGLVWLAIWGMLSSVIGVYYYLRPIVHMYMKPAEMSVQLHSRMALLVTSVCGALILVLGVFSSPFYQAVTRAVANTLN